MQIMLFKNCKIPANIAQKLLISEKENQHLLVSFLFRLLREIFERKFIQFIVDFFQFLDFRF